MVKEYWEWLISPNIAAIGRLAYAFFWIRRSAKVLGGAWAILRANWSPSMLVVLFIGPGEIGFCVIVATVILYALLPYGIYTYCAQRRIGALGNAGLNFAAWYVLELLLDYAGALMLGYFLD